jgi:uncharacterized membrane protein YccC
MGFDKVMQESIKVGLVVSLSIVVSLWLGWKNTYWSAVTVFYGTESYSHALKALAIL